MSKVELDRSLMALLAVSTFAFAGTIHYQTPMLGQFGIEFKADAAAVGWVATLTFGGFFAGIVLLVPLGDRIDKRRLILGQLACLIVCLLGMAVAPSLPALAAVSFVLGFFSGITQNIVPLVTQLARPEERGRALGTILSALFFGVLFGRLAGGLIASHFGWRWSYVLAAVMLLALMPALVRRLPSVPAGVSLPYGKLLWSMLDLLRQHVDLRRASALQFLLGICYGGFWATMAAMLLALHNMGPAQAGLMGIPGVAGILIARPAGRWVDRRGAGPVVATGICLVLAAYVALGFAAVSIGAVIAGAILLDCGLRSAMVANQTLAISVAPEAGGRLNTIFGAHVWGGNATGAFLASFAFTYAGWLGVCGIAMVSASVALFAQLRTSRAL